MPTGSGLWHFLCRLVRKFIRWVVSSEKGSVLFSAGRTDKYSTLRLLSVQIHTDIRNTSL